MTLHQKSTGAAKGIVGQLTPHDSATKHVTGKAIYIDDIAEPLDLLHVQIGLGTKAHARILSMDLTQVRSAGGVIGVFTAQDIPGENDVSPIMGDDPLFADQLVEYWGQSLFAVAATSRTAARAAAQLAIVEYEDLPAILTIEQAVEQRSFLYEPYEMVRGEAAPAIKKAPHSLAGEIEIGGQEHFYLEGQAAMAVPGEDRDITVYSSSQHPSEVQHKVAHVLGLQNHEVTAKVRRMGGAFGGKESQSNLAACTAALVARLTGRAAKVVYDRDDDMMITGKRHDFLIKYDVGFTDSGEIVGLDVEQAFRCGMSWDLSQPIGDRAMFHADNCYFLPHVRIRSLACKTNTQSNTAFRGFGGPQGMLGMERIIDHIAQTLGKDPLEIRRLNFYAHKDDNGSDRRATPFHMQVEDCIIQDIVDDLAKRSDYQKRRTEIRAWNSQNRTLKKGIALTPVKFGISFTKTFLNQAGALVHVYSDGSIQLNHGGTEMGQGLNTKIAQIVAHEFGVDLDVVKITATTTDKVPNTSATAASSGSDLNGMAARDAACKIIERIKTMLVQKHDVDPKDIVFKENKVFVGEQQIDFSKVVEQAYMARVSLSATGFYATPKIHWNREKASGRPFFYCAYGAAVSEVAIDVLTGENRILRVDILHDVGRSLNPALDLGQIEGGYVQGAGWLTTEELVWNDEGRLMTHAPSTYKIPACSDRARDMRIALYEAGENSEETIHRSKAVGEPPLMLAISAFLALSDAVASVADYQIYPELDAPATPERILGAIERLKALREGAKN